MLKNKAEKSSCREETNHVSKQACQPENAPLCGGISVITTCGLGVIASKLATVGTVSVAPVPTLLFGFLSSTAYWGKQCYDKCNKTDEDLLQTLDGDPLQEPFLTNGAAASDDMDRPIYRERVMIL
ncbi:MAG TPA: hypothetical protein VLG38_04570 [Gammaproteobacteria bacterium]|nr:hypothetical protein [Gammaproteobacteria bacterium]